MALAAVLSLSCLAIATANMEINILHLNDHHSHISDDAFTYDVSGVSGMSVSGQVKVRYGGYARLSEKEKCDPRENCPSYLAPWLPLLPNRTPGDFLTG